MAGKASGASKVWSVQSSRVLMTLVSVAWHHDSPSYGISNGDIVGIEWNMRKSSISLDTLSESNSLLRKPPFELGKSQRRGPIAALDYHCRGYEVYELVCCLGLSHCIPHLFQITLWLAKSCRLTSAVNGRAQEPTVARFKQTIPFPPFILNRKHDLLEDLHIFGTVMCNTVLGGWDSSSNAILCASTL